MKKFLLVMLLFPFLVISSVNASIYSSYLPGGKNYFDPNNFTLRDTLLESNDLIKVKTNTSYVLSLPNNEILGTTYIKITGTTTLIEGYTSQLIECSSSDIVDYCIFNTQNDDLISISIDAVDIAQYIDYFGYENFQLEEGTVPTAYEEYIPPFVDVNSPEFSGIATFVKAYYETITVDQIISNHIIAYDEVDGDLTANIVVENDNYSANMYITGEYSVDLSVADSSGNVATMILYIIVKDEVSPTIIGPNEVIINVNNHLNLTQILDSYYSVSDGHDGVVALQVLNDNYTGNESILGSYLVTLYAEDASLNSVQRDITITVQDADAPQLVSSTTQKVNLSQNLNIIDFINTLEFIDNYDSQSSLTIDLVSEDPFINNLPGEYVVSLIVTDLSNNQSYIDINLTILDDIAPTINGPTNITVSYIDAPIITDILAMFTVSDNIDSMNVNQLQIISDNYQSRTALVGNFIVEFELTDSSGNIATHMLEINLIDNQKPVLYIDQYLVTVTKNATLTGQDVLSMMMNNGEIPNGSYQITTLLNEYNGNEKNPGTYLYQLLFTDEDGNSYQKDLVVKVIDSDKQENSFKWIRPATLYLMSTIVVIYVVWKKPQ